METFEEKEVKRERRKKNGVKVIDATAAPGNKTTMAAAMAGEDGRIIAVERDAGRYKVLKEMCQKAGAKSEFNFGKGILLNNGVGSRFHFADVIPMNVDFLAIDPADPKHKNVTHFLVDPSCCSFLFYYTASSLTHLTKSPSCSQPAPEFPHDWTISSPKRPRKKRSSEFAPSPIFRSRSYPMRCDSQVHDELFILPAPSGARRTRALL